MADDDLSRIEIRIHRIENRQDKQESMLSDNIDRVLNMSVTLARQDERLVSIDRTVTTIHEYQRRREELEQQYRETDSRAKIDDVEQKRQLEEKQHQQRILWAAGAILMLSLLVINIIVSA